MSEDPLTIGTGHKIVGWNRLFEKEESLSLHLQMRAAIGSVVTQGNESTRCVHVNAILFVCKMRTARATGRKNQIRFSAIGWNPDQIGIGRLPSIERAVFAVIRVAAQQNDFCSVWRIRRIAVKAG